MLPYLLKRLLLAIPALWLMATVVFLLSRLLPGSFASERILESSAGYYSKGTESDRQAAYQSYVRRTGLDLPLFYFSVAPATQPPDSLNQIYNEPRQEQLRKLAWHYGSKHHAVAYLSSTELLERQLQTYPDASLKHHLQILRAEVKYEHLQKTAKSAVAVASNPQVKQAAEQVLERLQIMQQERASFAFLVPQLSWNGRQNQYHQWLIRLLQGDLGTSYRSSRPVLALLIEAIGNTWWLLICSMAITLALALELSILMVKKKSRFLHKLLLPFLFITDSIPVFVLALLLLVLLANPDFIQLFPVYGMGYYSPQQLSFWQQLSQWWQYMTLPMLCLVLSSLPYITNQVYASIHSAMRADYTRTARAKGLAEGAIIRRHVLRNSLLPIITIASDILPALVAGTLIIETIFAVPGIGRLLIDSVMARDYPVLIGIVLVIAAFRIIAFLLADLGYAWTDPRIKQQLA
ncbi:ABC transporter permease [Pontibacter diazotrophicus]|uniref:ABC transporter permease n=1 Tax=Pontibacter diazotrophicus TaxID=1400979 RepID=A0A3D8LA67_9BACT|nr:ABC transporter permease [Pontibacter diazotrophicus]RDV14277.1 ABC transporter permease [Pontibacter diazotrophicus]